tara:strand:- start:296 stop:838 length:543 start_codon:yes stop_codon:yes gene_type:complete
MFVDSTPFIIALVITFCFLICVVIWNNINAPPPPKKASPIEPGPSRTREILARFSEFYLNLNPEGEMIFDSGILPDPKQHIIHALYVGFDESENEDERSAIERGLRAIVTFQERIGEIPLKQEISDTVKVLNEITPNMNDSNQNINLENDEAFKKAALIRDQELDIHFQHLKIDILESST